MGGQVSDKQWTNLTGGPRSPVAPPLRPPSAPLELVKDAPIIDAFDDPQAYEAVRALHARSNDVYFFIGGRTVPHVRPYAYFQGVDPLPDGSGLLLHWPGIRFEVHGDNLLPAIGRLSQRRADVWRVFRRDYHVAPAQGATVIRELRAILDGDAEDAGLDRAAVGRRG